MKRISSFFTSLLRYFQKINFTTIFRKIKLSENVCKAYTAESIITERYTPSINHRQFLGQFSKNQYYLNSQEIDRFENFEQRKPA